MTLLLPLELAMRLPIKFDWLTFMLFPYPFYVTLHQVFLFLDFFLWVCSSAGILSCSSRIALKMNARSLVIQAISFSYIQGQ